MTCSRSVSSTKAYPEKHTCVEEIGDINFKPKPLERIYVRIGELSTAHILGPAPFPWQMPCIGNPESSSPP